MYELVCISLFPLFMIGMLYAKYYDYNISIKRIKRMVKEAGGSQIVIDTDWSWISNRGSSFDVRYLDLNGRRVQRFALETTGRIFWDKPLSDPEDASYEAGNSSSKEQIISDMTAEIEALQKKLDEQSGDSAENHPNK